MYIDTKEHLHAYIRELGIPADALQLPDIQLEAENIKAVLINEVPPQNPGDYFYSKAENPDYMRTTLGLFRDAGVDVSGISDIVGKGIYITTAVKSPKNGYAVEDSLIVAHLPILEKEIGLFPNLKVIMLMGDVAKKAFNMIAKMKTKKNCIPSGATYKIRGEAFYYGSIRVFPSYIMTGGNIMIEKSKCGMISDDLRRMMQII